MHTMIMVGKREGTEEWLCFSCGRHLLVSRNPIFKKTVLVEGDPLANHTRIKINTKTGEKRDKPLALLPNPDKDVDVQDDDPRLLPWLKWMEESGFDNLWNSDLP
jgi:hypothetical protein